MIEIKYNITHLKWAFTIFFLCWNLFLLTIFNADSTEDCIVISIIVGSGNLLAIASYVLFSFFPKWYYVFDSTGVAFCMRKDRVKIRVNWEDVEDVSYVYFCGILPEGLQVRYSEHCITKFINLSLSEKEISEVCKHVPEFNAIYNGEQ